MPLSFVFDQNRCTGCQACQLACIIENQLPPDGSWREVYTFNERHYPGAPLFHLSLACNHCSEPACMEACPALAYARDPVTGAVLVDPDKCIGCRYCTWACPYDAPKYDDTTGTVTKCTLCNHRLDGGQRPACVESCPTGALELADLSEDELVNDVAGFTASDLGPRITIVPVRDDRLVPEHAESFSAAARGNPRKPAAKITLRHEWPLAAFTLVAGFLAGLFPAATLGGLRVSAAAFVLPALFAAALGALHLGNRHRAWRIVLGVANSWLSREIVLFGTFVSAGAVCLWFSPIGAAFAWSVTVLGFAALVAVDMVYRYGLRAGASLPHSASVFLTGLLFAGVLGMDPALAGTAGCAKAVLYLVRRSGAGRSASVAAHVAAALRIGLGILMPAVLWIGGWAGPWVLVSLVCLGEAIDRGEFYRELEVMTPDLQMTLDEHRMLSRSDRGVIDGG